MKKWKFKARAGQMDYTHASWAPVINCVVRYKNKILLVKRSQQLGFYPGYWNGISGFLDDARSLKEKVIDEVTEELGIAAGKIKKIKMGEIYHGRDHKLKKTWIVHPVLVDLSTNQITLDWEASAHVWISPNQIKKYKTLPGFGNVLKRVLKYF